MMQTPKNRTEFFNQMFPDNRSDGDTALRQAQHVMLRMLKVVDYVCQKHNIQYWLESGTLLGAIRHKGFIPWDDDLDIGMPRDDYSRFIKIAPQEFPEDIFLQTPHTDPGYYNFATQLKVRDCKSEFVELYENGDERYHTGIFIDVFPLDNMSENRHYVRWNSFLARKISRLICPKMSDIPIGHHFNFYKWLGKLFKQSWLEHHMGKIIKNQSRLESPLIGYGYNSVINGTFPKEWIFPLKRVRFEDAEFLSPRRHHEFLTHLYGDYMTPPPPGKRTLKHSKVIVPVIGVAE